MFFLLRTSQVYTQTHHLRQKVRSRWYYSHHLAYVSQLEFIQCICIDRAPISFRFMHQNGEEVWSYESCPPPQKKITTTEIEVIMSDRGKDKINDTFLKLFHSSVDTKQTTATTNHLVLYHRSWKRSATLKSAFELRWRNGLILGWLQRNDYRT